MGINLAMILMWKTQLLMIKPIIKPLIKEKILRKVGA
jgi:hypothetical protein